MKLLAAQKDMVLSITIALGLKRATQLLVAISVEAKCVFTTIQMKALKLLKKYGAWFTEADYLHWRTLESTLAMTELRHGERT